MSRIDKALRTWEKKGAAETSERFELGKYENEATASPRVEFAHPAEPSVWENRPPSPVVPPPTSQQARADSSDGAPKHVAGSPVSSNLEARLVTGGSGAVSLEQYRRLAAVLHDIQLQQGLKTLMLTSALPAEGKTLTTVNLALTLSESYARRVLIIDADLRWPSVHKVFGLINGAGLSDALHGESGELPFRHVSPRLAVLTAGKPGVTPLAGLTSAKMGGLVDSCASQFDWVLLDTPPVGLLPDAQLLARLTRAVVFVIAAGITPSTTVERAIAELGPDCVIGTVLNRVDNRRIPEAGYYSRYGYGYAETNET
jgi:protein-tyrosine kinase